MPIRFLIGSYSPRAPPSAAWNSGSPWLTCSARAGVTVKPCCVMLLPPANLSLTLAANSIAIFLASALGVLEGKSINSFIQTFGISPSSIPKLSENSSTSISPFINLTASSAYSLAFILLPVDFPILTSTILSPPNFLSILPNACGTIVS